MQIVKDMYERKSSMSEQNQFVIGMDCGTTNIKAVVLRSDGRVIAKASRPSTFLQPGPNMHEQDANEWWKSASEIFAELSGCLSREDLTHIMGICVSSHTVTMLPVNSHGMPLRMAMTYQDGRSSAELNEIVETIGRDRFTNIVGGQPSVAFLPNKLLWFKRNEPDLYERTAFFLQASSYINYKLTDVMVTDEDQAYRTQCMDVAKKIWSEQIASLIDEDLLAKMPVLKQVDEIIGYVTPKAARETGLVPGIPVLAGCSDAMAAMYATGISRLGEAGESSGTTSLVFAGSEVQSPTDVPVITRPCVIDHIPWVFDAPIQSSGAAIQWMIDKLAVKEREYADSHGLNVYEYLNELALQTRPGAGGLLFFPYLLGERAPLWNDHASGMFIGLRMSMERNDLIRAVFEGTAFALRHVVETVRKSGARIDLLRICGGGSRSRTWNMIKASVLNIPVYVMSGESGDVPVGDALIAGHRVGMFPDLSEAVKKILSVEEVVAPIPEWTEVYNKLYPYYVSMYQKLDPDLKSLKNTLEEL